jgi:hypothetical protein
LAGEAEALLRDGKADDGNASAAGADVKGDGDFSDEASGEEEKAAANPRGGKGDPPVPPAYELYCAAAAENLLLLFHHVDVVGVCEWEVCEEVALLLVWLPAPLLPMVLPLLELPLPLPLLKPERWLLLGRELGVTRLAIDVHVFPS